MRLKQPLNVWRQPAPRTCPFAIYGDFRVFFKPNCFVFACGKLFLSKATTAGPNTIPVPIAAHGLLKVGHDIGGWELRVHQVERHRLLPTVATCYPRRERAACLSRPAYHCPASDLSNACRARSSTGSCDRLSTSEPTHLPTHSLPRPPIQPASQPPATAINTNKSTNIHTPKLPLTLSDAPTRHYTEHVTSNAGAV